MIFWSLIHILSPFSLSTCLHTICMLCIYIYIYIYVLPSAYMKQVPSAYCFWHNAIREVVWACGSRPPHTMLCPAPTVHRPFNNTCFNAMPKSCNTNAASGRVPTAPRPGECGCGMHCPGCRYESISMWTNTCNLSLSLYKYKCMNIYIYICSSNMWQKRSGVFMKGVGTSGSTAQLLLIFDIGNDIICMCTRMYTNMRVYIYIYNEM